MSLLFYSGMLSKSLGQVYRLATVLHVLFSPDEEAISDNVTESAVKAAVNVVQTACQQTAYIAGRGTIQEELVKCKTGQFHIYTV